MRHDAGRKLNADPRLNRGTFAVENTGRQAYAFQHNGQKIIHLPKFGEWKEVTGTKQVHTRETRHRNDPPIPVTVTEWKMTAGTGEGGPNEKINDPLLDGLPADYVFQLASGRYSDRHNGDLRVVEDYAATLRERYLADEKRVQAAEAARAEAEKRLAELDALEAQKLEEIRALEAQRRSAEAGAKPVAKAKT